MNEKPCPENDPAWTPAITRVTAIIAGYSPCPRDPTTILPDHRLREDLGLDSIDDFDLVLDIEEAFGIVIQDEEAAACLTPAHLVALIERNWH